MIEDEFEEEDEEADEDDGLPESARTPLREEEEKDFGSQSLVQVQDIGSAFGSGHG